MDVARPKSRMETMVPALHFKGMLAFFLDEDENETWLQAISVYPILPREAEKNIDCPSLPPDDPK